MSQRPGTQKYDGMLKQKLVTAQDKNFLVEKQIYICQIIIEPLFKSDLLLFLNNFISYFVTS